MPGHFCVSKHNSTASKQLRYALSRESVCATALRGLRPLGCGFIYFVMGISAGFRGAHSLVRAHSGGAHELPFELRFAVKWLYELCFLFSMLDETVETRPPWLDFSLPCPPWQGISVFLCIILQPLNSSAMRSHGSPCAPPLCGAYGP